MNLASGISSGSRAELARLLARGCMRAIATRSEHPASQVLGPNSENRVADVVGHEQVCVHAGRAPAQENVA